MPVFNDARTRLAAAFTVSALCALAASACAASAQPQNLARGRPYTIAPPPNYNATVDEYDDRQLTDGGYARSRPIWMSRTTVGWSDAAPVTVVIDLGTIQPIGGVSYNTAAGSGGVQWPRSVFVLVSDDGREFFPIADLADGAAGGSAPTATGYATHQFTITGLNARGRFVALLVDQAGRYTFSDEIEVLAGDASAPASPRRAESTIDLQDFFVRAHMHVSIQRRLAIDLEIVRAALARSAFPASLQERRSRELDRLAADAAAVPEQDPKTFRAVLPLSEVHARIFAAHGTIAGASGLPPLAAWAANPWDFVRPLDKAPGTAPDHVSIAAMNGETRSGAVSMANSTSEPLMVRLDVTGWPGGLLEQELQLAEVVWTDTRELIPVADALAPLAAGTRTVTLPAGMTRQIWLRFAPRDRPPGRYGGALELTSGRGAPVRVALEFTVLPGRFPVRPALHLGGWDYTNTITYGLTAANVPPLIDTLHALGVDSPWAN